MTAQDGLAGGRSIYAISADAYPGVRRPDPRIGRRLAAASVGRVLNVGAGTGSYEADTNVFAGIEPSGAMLRQRDPAGAPAVRGRAEALPFAERACDTTLAILTTHHWLDLRAGLAEMLRVSRRRVVVFTWGPSQGSAFWLLRDYLPPEHVAWDLARFPPLAHLLELLPGARVETVPIPHDCTDGFLGAYWRRPEAYLSPTVRRGMSSLVAWEDRLAEVWPRLEADLQSGAWHARHGDLLSLEELDLGYRIVVAPVGGC